MKSEDINWLEVNWKEQDIVLSKKLRMTRERIRQKRAELRKLLEKKDWVRDLLDNAEQHLTRLQSLRTEYLTERKHVMSEIARIRGLIQRKEAKPAEIEELKIARKNIRIHLKTIRHQLEIIDNPLGMRKLLGMEPSDLVAEYWHRPRNTKRVVEVMAALSLEGMTRVQIRRALRNRGIIRGYSWISNMLTEMGRTCKRVIGKHKKKYDWGKLSKYQYQHLPDPECARLLGIDNPAVVTQWRNHSNPKIRKVRRVVAVAG